MKPEALEKVLEQGGRLPLGALLLCRCRWMTNGAILGSQEFVRAQLEYFRDKLGPRSKDPVPVPIEDCDLAVMRQPRRPIFL